MKQRGVMFNVIWSILILAGILYSLICLYLYLAQARLIFFPHLPSRKLAASPVEIGLEYESVSIKTNDQIIIYGWFVPALEERGTLLFFHGNAGNISHRLDSIKIFHDLGLSVLIIDYRGFGRSQGQVSENGTYLDAEAAWNYLTERRKVPPKKIIVFGRSLGASIAAKSAEKNTPGALILESAFTSVPDMASRLYPVFPVRFLSRFQFNTRRSLQSVNCPVLIIHSPDDEIIPLENGLQLYRTAREPKTMLKIRGNHNEGFMLSGKKYVDGISDFLTENLSEYRERKENMKDR